jgi:hypothetical protein
MLGLLIAMCVKEGSGNANAPSDGTEGADLRRRAAQLPK